MLSPFSWLLLLQVRLVQQQYQQHLLISREAEALLLSCCSPWWSLCWMT
jgi:hypothetical protein